MARQTKIKQDRLEQIKDMLVQNTDGSYIQKSGTDYIIKFQEYVKNKFSKKSKNLQLFTVDKILELGHKKNNVSFAGINDFKYVCSVTTQKLKISADLIRENEKIIIKEDTITQDGQKIIYESKGVVYLITCMINNDEYIIKFGQTRKTFKERLDSYNCGVILNLGTASTTNIHILQSLLANEFEYKIYICDCSDVIEQFKWHGIKSREFASSKSLAFENIILKEFKKEFGSLPVANTQVEDE